MKTINNNLKTSISTKKIILFTILWVFSTIVFIILMTNFFSENPFQNKYVGFYLIIFVSTFGIVRLHNIYWKSQQRI